MFNSATLPENADLIFPGDLVWMLTEADSDDWHYDEYAEAGLLIDTDPANGVGLVAHFNFEIKKVVTTWVRGINLQRRYASEGVFTFDRVVAETVAKALVAA